MSVLSEENAGASLAADADPLSIAAVTSRVEYTGQLEPDNPGQTRQDSSLETQWIRQLVACYPGEIPGSLAHPITPDTLIPVMYWSTLSTYQNGTEHIDLVPLWMLASGEKAFLRTYLSTPPDDAELETTLLGSAQAPYRWHMKIFWGDEQSAGTFSDYNRKQLADAVPADVLGALAGLNDGLLQAIRQGMPRSYNGFASLAVGMDCGTLEQELRSEADDTFKRPERQPRAVYDQVLEPVSLLPNGLRFRPHKFAGQWLSERGLSSNAQVRVDYHEVETIDSASAKKSASVPLLHVVTQGFLSTHQSKDKFYSFAASAREGWRYPHISQMTVDFSSLQVNGRALAPELLRQLQEGVPPGYQGPGQSLITDVDEQGKLLGPQEKARLRQMELLDLNQVKLARLFAGLPTFDSALKNLLVRMLGEKFEVRQFHASLPAPIDPDNCYVNHFVTDSSGGRSLTSSQSFTEVIQDCLQRDTPPRYLLGEVGFFRRPDSVSEEDSVFADPVDAQVLRTMESVFYFPQPATNVSVRRQLRDDLTSFRNSRTWGYLLEPPRPSSAEAALAYLLAQRFQHLLNLYRADQEPATQLTRSARVLRAEEDRLLDLITTHPSLAARNDLVRMPVPHVYAVMLDTGSATAQKWPAAMVIKVPDRRSLFLYSLEGGIQRFGSFQALVSNVHPLYKGQECTIRDISTQVSEQVFEVAAEELLQLQRTALEAALTVPDVQAPALSIFVRSVEDALALPMLGLSGPLAVRQKTLVENNRPNLYKTATQSEKNRYRLLEEQVIQKANKVGKEVPTLWEFTRQKVKEYMQENLHPGVDFDPDKTLVTLASGTNTDPGKSRVTNLTQWMLDNLRPRQYPSAMRDVQPIHLTDKKGRRVRNPANGYFYTLTGIELARMTKSIDAGGSYEPVLVEALNKPDYKAAWQAAYLANMRFKGYEAALRGNEAFKVIVKDEAFNPPKPCKQLALWLDAVLKSPSAQTRARVGGKKVHVHALLLGGSLGDGRSHGSGGAASIEGALILSDRQRPEIEGTVGVYFPDSPDGNDFHEFSDLSDGVARLLLREEWYGYFRSRISLVEPEQIKRILGRRGGRPFVECSLIDDDSLETLHRAHVSFHRAHTAERSTSNRDVQVTFSDIIPEIIGGVLDVVSLLLVPGYLLIKRAITISWAMFKTGLVPLNAKSLKLLYLLESTRGGLAGGMTVPSRGQSSFLAVMAGQSQSEGRLGLSLEEAVYRRYAVTDASPIRGLTPDAQGFYRVTLKDSSTGRVTARPVYIQQRDGTVFRVHDHTRLNATDANIVDPVTGLSIRSSGVTRSTVARMPDGEWRAVGFGLGGGKRSGSSLAGSSEPKVPALLPSAVSNLVRTPGSWDHQIMDLVPGIMTRLPGWPHNRSLLIIDEIAASRGWSVRYTPGQADSVHYLPSHMDRLDSDIVLTRTSQNHYSLVLHGNVVEIPADGDCFFNAVAHGLNAGRTHDAFTVQQLRDAAADYIDQHPQISDFLAPHAPLLRQALFDSGPKTVWHGGWQSEGKGKIRPFALRHSAHATKFRLEAGSWSSRNPFYPFIRDRGLKPYYDGLLAKAAPAVRAATTADTIKQKVEAFTQWGLEIDLSTLAFFKVPGHVGTEVIELNGGLIADLVSLELNGQAAIRRLIEPMAGSGYYSNYARVVGFDGEVITNDFNPLISWTQKEIVNQPDRVKHYIDFIKNDLVSMGESSGLAFDPANLSIQFKTAREAKDFSGSEAVNNFRDKVKNYFDEVVDVVVQIKDGDAAVSIPRAKGTYVIADLRGDQIRISAPPPEADEKAFLAAAYYLLQNNHQRNIVEIKKLNNGKYSLHLPIFLMTPDYKSIHLFRYGLANTNHLNYLSHVHKSATRPTRFLNEDGWALLDNVLDRNSLGGNQADLVILSGHFSDVYIAEADFMKKIKDHVVPLSDNGAKVIVTNAYSLDKERSFKALGFYTFKKTRPGTAKGDYLLAINKPVMQAAQSLSKV